MTYAFPPSPSVALPIAGRDELFPVRRVFCVGRNYAAHAREMGNDPKEPPFFFAKPADALVPGGGDVPYPPATDDYHHEIELVVAIGVGGTDIDPARALEHVYGYAVGLDMTRRDLQKAAKDSGKPWDMAKGFDKSAPIAAIHRRADVGDIASRRISLAVNGAIRQDADLADMIWPIPEIIAHLSRLVELRPGDLIFTGTPDGVGAAERGDLLVGAVGGLTELKIRIV